MKLGRMLLGLIGGFTFGMLFAPKKGKDLRKELLKKSGESGGEALRALGDALASAGKEAYEEFLKCSDHEQVKALKSLSKEKLDEFMENAGSHGYEIAEKVQEKLEKASDFLAGEAKSALGVAKKAAKDLKITMKHKSVAKKN